MGSTSQPASAGLSGPAKFAAAKKEIAQRNDAVQRAARKVRTAREEAASAKRRRLEKT